MTTGRDDPLPPSSVTTLIGYITGPQAQQPVGVRVVEPPPGTRQYQRGSLYGVVDLTGDHPDRDAIADFLLSLMQRTYYTEKGSQSQVMLESIERVQQALSEINARNPDSRLAAGILCAAMLGGRLLVATSGPAFALVRVNERVQMFPAEVASPATDGVHNVRPPEIYRQDLRRDDALFVGGGSWLDRVEIKPLAGVVGYVNAENCTDAADGLYSLVSPDAPPGLIIVLTGGLSRGDSGLGPGMGGGQPPRPGPRSPRSRLGGLPTALSATVVVRAPGYQSGTATALGPAATLPEGSLPAAAMLSSFESAAAPAAGIAAAPADEPPADETATVDEGSRTAKPAVVVAAVASRAKRFFAKMLPDQEPDAADRAATVPAASVVMAASVAEAIVGPAAAVEEIAEPPEPARASEPDVLPELPPPPTPEITPFTPPQPASGARARLFILLAVLVAVLVPVVVLVVTLGNGIEQQRQAAKLTEAAYGAVASAQVALNTGDKNKALTQFVEAREYLAQAIALDGGNDARDELAPVIESELQDLLQLMPLYLLSEPLITFPQEARPYRVLVADNDIFVVDAAQQAVLRYRYDPADQEVADNNGQVILEQGQTVDGVIVGSLADLAWLPLIPGVEDKPTLLILDRNNNLFSYDPRVEGAKRLDLADQAEWRSAAQVQTYTGRLYVADEGANQIYRYDPGQLSTPPADWFGEHTLVNLAGAIAMEIDGDIWILLDKGNIVRYSNGEQVPFTLETSIDLADEPVDMVVTTQDRSLIYLADAGEDRVLVYDKDGAYQGQLTAPEGDLLQGLSGIYVDEVGNRIYLLTKKGLYVHPLLP